MNVKFALAGLAALAASGIPTAVLADSAEQQFQAGITAARANDYLAALRHFEQARAAGLQSAGLYYNLGVANYRLGRYEAAFEAFGRAAMFPQMAALAHYNQGLVASAQGRPQVADRLFQRTLAETQDPKLRALAEGRLAPLPATKSEIREWYVSGSLGGGYDDNLIDPLSLTASTRGDGFLETYASAGGAVIGDLSSGLRAEASAYSRRYQELNDYDNNFYQLGLTAVHPLGQWQGEAGVRVDQSTLGSRDYLRNETLELALLKPPSQGPGYRLRYRFSNIESLSTEYDPLAGTRHRADADIRWPLNRDTELVTGYSIESNDRADYQANGTFVSYSPLRQAARLAAKGSQGRLEWGARTEYMVSDYRGTNRAPGLRVDRYDETLTAALNMGWRISDVWRLGADYSYTDNRSNVDGYSYDQNVYSLSVQGFY